MATVTVKHATLTNAAANPNVLVDGPKWDAGHTVTGLENVDNTSDASKPVSTAQATAIANVAANTRSKLTANATYYVRTDGSDSNTGLANTAGGAFLTIQKAVDTAVTLDLSIYTVTIQVGAGTYTTPVVLKSYLGAGPITLLGDAATPANVIISTTSASCIAADTVYGKYIIQGFKLQSTTSGVLLNVLTARVSYLNIEFGTAAGGNSHVVAQNGAVVTMDGNCAISGGADAHFNLAINGVIRSGSRTITITGTPAFSTAFVKLTNLCVIRANSMTFSGAATGVRYSVDTSSSIYTGGGGASYFPGNSAGTADAATYGSYS